MMLHAVVVGKTENVHTAVVQQSRVLREPDGISLLFAREHDQHQTVDGFGPSPPICRSMAYSHKRAHVVYCTFIITTRGFFFIGITKTILAHTRALHV